MNIEEELQKLSVQEKLNLAMWLLSEVSSLLFDGSAEDDEILESDDE